MSTPAAAGRPGVFPVLYRVVRTVLAYVGVVAGGLTVFLTLTPLLGYLAYSDRPGPGWFGRFPAMGWGEFWNHAWNMMSIGSFIAVLYVVPALVLLGMVRMAEGRGISPRAVWIGAAAVSAAFAAYWTMGVGWYFNGSPPVAVMGMVLGAAAGAWVLPAGARRRVVNGGAVAALALLATIPAYTLWDAGAPHQVVVRFSQTARDDQVRQVWNSAGAVEQFTSAGSGIDADGRRTVTIQLHPRTSDEQVEAFRGRMASLPGVESARTIPRYDGP